MCGEFTVELIRPGRYECNYTGEPKPMTKIVFAKDKRIATKIFMDYLRAADRAARRGEQRC